MITFANSSDSLMEPLEMLKYKSKKVLNKCISSMGIGLKKPINDDDYDDGSTDEIINESDEFEMIDVGDVDMNDNVELKEDNEMEVVDEEGLNEFVDDSLLSVLKYFSVVMIR